MNRPKKSQISSHASHSSADHYEGTSHKKRNTNENFAKSVNNPIKRLEGSLQSLEGSVSKLDGLYKAVAPIGYKQASVSSVLLLTDTQKCNIGHMVRNKMFRGIKFLDNQMLYSEGNKILDRFLEAANIKEVEDRTALFKAFISCARHYLNKHKGHVRRKIRAAATRKYLLNCLFSHDCNLINN